MAASCSCQELWVGAVRNSIAEANIFFKRSGMCEMHLRISEILRGDSGRVN